MKKLNNQALNTTWGGAALGNSKILSPILWTEVIHVIHIQLTPELGLSVQSLSDIQQTFVYHLPFLKNTWFLFGDPTNMTTSSP
jgi:hypothetical protein